MYPRHTRARRARTIAASAAAAALGLSLAAAPAQAGGESDAAVSWVDGQLVDDLALSPFGGSDVGLSIDVGLLALAAGDNELAQRVYVAVTDAYDTGDFPYVGAGTPGGGGEAYVNAIAKLARFVQLAGGDPRDVDGRDLIADLEALTDDASGRIADQSEFGDFASTIGQSFAVAALSAAGSDEADAALAYLLDQQCDANGGFRPSLGAVGAVGDAAGCTNGFEAGLDATAFVVQLLAPLDLAPAATSAAADFLERLQDPNGGNYSNGSDNTNTTGLVAYALSLEGRDDAATVAADFVRGLQVRAPGACTDADEGAVAFDRAAFNAQKLDGITADTRDQFVRATAQAGLVLDLVSEPTEQLVADAPTEYVRARSLQPVLVRGLASRDTVCVSIGRFGVDEVTGIEGSTTVRVTTGPGTAVRTYEVADTYGRTTEVSMRVLGPKTLTVRAPAQRVRGSKMRVVARGLAPGEKATLFVSRGDTRTQFANRDGRVEFRGVDVVRKPGNRRYVVRGKFSRIRKGSDVVRVLRSR